jgi:NAD(P)-dependent dehydrogenase (short-subunit alcohol dehydrogenase family)
MSFWQNKTVVVTGGYAGLGKAISLAFARQGARVVVLARNETGINQMIEQAVAENPSFQLFPCVADVTDDTSVQQALQQILSRFQRLDVWVNNVGQSVRHDLLSGKVDDYHSLMEINFYSAVRGSLAALPHLVETRGSLVNIGSLASKTAWPLMAPYSASKHALAAFHHQLRLEGPSKVHYLHVCPGPIQRSDAGNRYQAQPNGLDQRARQPGAGVKLAGIPPEQLAIKIVEGCRNRRTELVMPGKARWLFALAQLCPDWADRILNRSRKKSDH